MTSPLTYSDGTKSKLGDLVEVVTPRGEKSFAVVVENGVDGVWAVPVPRSSAIFVTSAKPASQANAEAVAQAELEAEANAERLAAVAKAAQAEAEAARPVPTPGLISKQPAKDAPAFAASAAVTMGMSA